MDMGDAAPGDGIYLCLAARLGSGEAQGGGASGALAQRSALNRAASVVELYSVAVAVAVSSFRCVQG